MASFLQDARELVRGSEITIGTVVIGVIVWRLMTAKPKIVDTEEKKEKTKKSKSSSSTKSVVSKKADKPVEMEKVDYREDWTFEELSKYNGTDPSKPLLVSIKGCIFDTTTKIDMYGPGGPYCTFAGVDASYMLATMNTEVSQKNKPYDNLNPTEQQSLDGWETFFTGKYTVVGKIKDFTVS